MFKKIKHELSIMNWEDLKNVRKKLEDIFFILDKYTWKDFSKTRKCLANFEQYFLHSSPTNQPRIS